MMALGYVPGSKSNRHWSTRIFGSRRFSRAIEFRIISRWLDPGSRALDLGAGNGEFSAQLALRGYQVVAFDLDSRALQESRGTAVNGTTWVAGDATLLPFGDASFDFVLCNSAIEHFPDDRAAIRELCRVMKPGGRLIITTDSLPKRASRWLRAIPMAWRREDLRANGRLSDTIASSHQRRHHVNRFYDEARLRSLLHDAGFRVEDWRYYLNGLFSQGIFELHLVLAALDFYNHRSRRLFPVFFPFTFPIIRRRPGYGLAVLASRER
jgi:ubiquinone/menaquinone biosynthesis C-methylase UbiE